jgi:hypothetical protein
MKASRPVMEQTYLIHDEYHGITLENGVPFNHYWSDYRHSLSTWTDSGGVTAIPFSTTMWDIQFRELWPVNIQVQNDPQGERLESSNSKRYWRSRLKAMFWSAAYSMQWEIGPLSEPTLPSFDAGTMNMGCRISDL